MNIWLKGRHSSAAAETRLTEIIHQQTIPTVKQKTKPHFKREAQRKVLHLILLFFKLQKSHNLHLQMQKRCVHLHVVGTIRNLSVNLESAAGRQIPVTQSLYQHKASFIHQQKKV